MPTELDESFDLLTDADMWTDVAAIGAGYMGASVAQTVVDERIGFDLPNEVYGAAVAGVGYAYAPQYSAEIASGGALYTVDSLAQRAGLKNKVSNVGGN
jgi:hypothetical protein